MSAIFLSASVPRTDRGTYYETANPFLIQTAVRELVVAVIREHKLIYGGNPAITPMIWAICRDLNVDYADAVVLYQSEYFSGSFPEENANFGNVVMIGAVRDDRELSLARLREEMLSRSDLRAAVFIGGMEGVEAEYEIFRRLHPDAKVLPVPAPGGAALVLAKRLGADPQTLHDVDFARLFHTELLRGSARGEPETHA